MSVDEDAFEPGPLKPDDDGFVPALFARDIEEAEQYRELLSDHDIPARAGPDDELADPDADDAEHRLAGRRGITHGVPVLVPEALLDEASEIIADREEFAEFDEEDDDLDEDEDEDELIELDPDEEDAFVDDEEDDGLSDNANDEDEDEDEDLY